jgi:hypothetical protein
MKNWEKANENEEEMMSNNEESGNTVDVKEGMDWHEKHVLALQRICSLKMSWLVLSCCFVRELFLLKAAVT